MGNSCLKFKWSPLNFKVFCVCVCVCVCEQDCILLVFIFPNSVWFIHYAWLLCGLEYQINRFAKLGKCFSSMGMIFKFRQLFFGNKCISKDLFFTGGIPVLHYSIQKRKQLFEEWEEEPLNLVCLSIYPFIYLFFLCHIFVICDCLPFIFFFLITS